MDANRELIIKLVFESGLSCYRIAKMAEVPVQTVRDFSDGKTEIERMQFGTAVKLTEAAADWYGQQQEGEN